MQHQVVRIERSKPSTKEYFNRVNLMRFNLLLCVWICLGISNRSSYHYNHRSPIVIIIAKSKKVLVLEDHRRGTKGIDARINRGFSLEVRALMCLVFLAVLF